MQGADNQLLAHDNELVMHLTELKRVMMRHAGKKIQTGRDYASLKSWQPSIILSHSLVWVIVPLTVRTL